MAAQAGQPLTPITIGDNVRPLDQQRQAMTPQQENRLACPLSDPLVVLNKQFQNKTRYVTKITDLPVQIP